MVPGRAYSGDFPMIPVGTNDFLTTGFDAETPEGGAKAAAVHDALCGDWPRLLIIGIIA